MAGQLTVRIAGKEWLAGLASAPWELTQGLGGITGIPQGTGMLFDLGFEQGITVTTVPMLFPLDIAFLSGDLVVTVIYRDIQPGYMVNSTVPARYFLEVNSGEMEGIDPGEQSLLELLPNQATLDGPTEWVSAMAGLMGFMLMTILAGSLLKDPVKEFERGTKETMSFQASTEQTKGIRDERQSPSDNPQVLPVARILEKWSKAKARNSALAMKDLETLEPGYDTEDCKQALFDYREIEPADYDDREEYQEAREEAWEEFLECLESLAGEEEEMVNSERQPALVPVKAQPQKETNLNYLVDSPEYLTQTIEDIGYRDRIDHAFHEAIARARKRR